MGKRRKNRASVGLNGLEYSDPINCGIAGIQRYT